jgi:hypothetical protein
MHGKTTIKIKSKIIILMGWMKTNYLKLHYGQTMEVNEDVTDRYQDGLVGERKKEGNRVVETGWRIPMIEVGGDICLKRPRPTQGCRTDDDNDHFEVRKANWLEVSRHSFLTSALDRFNGRFYAPVVYA